MICQGDVARVPGHAGCRRLVRHALAPLRASGRVSGAGGLLSEAAWDALAAEGAEALTRLAVPETVLVQCAGGAAPLAGLEAVDDPVRVLDEAPAGSLPAALGRFLSDWRRGVAGMLERLATDRHALSTHFAIAPLAHVSAIEGPCSEYHGAACVRRIVFSDGRAVAYKPRAVMREAQWARLAGWLAETEVAELFAADTLVRDGYGWCAWIAAGEVPDDAALDVFYGRAGELLFWLWLTNSRDAVASNLVARGAEPVLIDCETCFYPGPAPNGAEAPPELFRTGYLPKPGGDPARSRAGLGCGAELRHAVRAVEIDRAGRVGLVRRDVADPSSRHIPRLGGFARPVQGAAVRRGFRAAWQRAAARASDLLGSSGPLRADIAGTGAGVGRFVLRPTVLYGELLAGYLAAGRRTGWLDEMLSALPPPVGPADPEAQARVRAQERDRLAALSVPAFAYRVTGEAVRLVAPDCPLPGLISGEACAARRLAALDEAGLAAALAEIEAALCAESDLTRTE